MVTFCSSVGGFPLVTNWKQLVERLKSPSEPIPYLQIVLQVQVSQPLLVFVARSTPDHLLAAMSGEFNKAGPLQLEFSGMGCADT